jgi:hypothetical protein
VCARSVRVRSNGHGGFQKQKAGVHEPLRTAVSAYRRSSTTAFSRARIQVPTEQLEDLVDEALIVEHPRIVEYGRPFDGLDAGHHEVCGEVGVLRALAWSSSGK